MFPNVPFDRQPLPDLADDSGPILTIVSVKFADAPSPNAPAKRDVLGTVLLSVLAGHWRYAHITALRADAVNAPLLGMRLTTSSLSSALKRST